MVDFFIPRGRSKIGNLATRDLFNTSIVANKDRTHTYKRWSEKATIVQYNEDLETYDIVVSTISYAGTNASVTKVNRTIRNVKSIIPTVVHIFQPGELVLIGYISERRESPVILGLKAAKANKTITTVTNTTDEPDESCPFRVTNLADATDITNDESIVVVCNSDYSAGGVAQVCVEAHCGGGQMAWDWDGIPSCKDSNGTSAYQIITSGINSRRVCFTKVGVTSSLGASHPCMARATCFRSQDNSIGGGCNFTEQKQFYNSSGTTITSLSLSCSSSFGGDCESCAAITCSTCDLPSNPNCTSCDFVSPESCADNDEIPIIFSGQNNIKRAYQLGYGIFQHEGGLMDEQLTAEQQADNMEQGCCMCALINNTVISVTDDNGNSWSAQLLVESDDLDYSRVF